jgi:hypothetical protein
MRGNDVNAVNARGMLGARWLIRLGAVGALTVSATGHAGGAARVSSVGTFGTQYAGGVGALAFILDIDNPTGATFPAEARWTWQTFPLQPAVSAPEPWAEFVTTKDFSVKPGSSLTDVVPTQALPVCGRATASVVLMSTAGSVDPAARRTQVHTSSCNYSVTFVDPTLQMAPDRVDYAEKGHVWINNATMTRPVVCERAERVRILLQLVNWSGSAGIVPLEIIDPDGTTVLATARVPIGKDAAVPAILEALRPTHTGKLTIRPPLVGGRGGRPAGELPFAELGFALDFEGVCNVSVDPLD